MTYRMGIKTAIQSPLMGKRDFEGVFGDENEVLRVLKKHSLDSFIKSIPLVPGELVKHVKSANRKVKRGGGSPIPRDKVESSLWLTQKRPGPQGGATRER